MKQGHQKPNPEKNEVETRKEKKTKEVEEWRLESLGYRGSKGGWVKDRKKIKDKEKRKESKE